MSRSFHEYGYMPRKKLEQIKERIKQMTIIEKIEVEKIVCYLIDLLQCDRLMGKQFDELMQVVGVDWRKVKWEPLMLEENYTNPFMF